MSNPVPMTSCTLICILLEYEKTMQSWKTHAHFGNLPNRYYTCHQCPCNLIFRILCVRLMRAAAQQYRLCVSVLNKLSMHSAYPTDTDPAFHAAIDSFSSSRLHGIQPQPPATVQRWVSTLIDSTALRQHCSASAQLLEEQKNIALGPTRQRGCT